LLTRDVHRVDEANYGEGHLHRVMPYETHDDKIKFDVVVVSSIEVYQTSHSQALDDETEKWFRVSCEALFRNGLNNLEIYFFGG
jgi:hypothetical protein